MMKLRSATPVSDLSFLGRVLIVASVVVMAVAVPVQLFTTKPASADEFDDKIRALNENIANYRNQANALREQANTLQSVVDQLSADKAAIQLEVNRNQLQHDQLVAEIATLQKRIDENRKVSGELIVKSSLSDDIPLVVRLAASENLADYIDGEASRISIRDTIVRKTEESNKLKKQLEEKKVEVKRVLDEQRFKRNELASKEAQQADILAQTRGDEAEYQKMIASSQGEIEKLRAQQEVLRNANRGGGGSFISVGGSGGYPWAGVRYPCWTVGCGDPWGLYYRECVSYVAWRLDNQGYGVNHFSGAGHAAQWPSTTAYYTQRVSAQKGAAMVRPTTTPYLSPSDWRYDVGHVAYVEEVYSDGSIRISEYNYRVDGTYGERKLTPAQYGGMIFLQFPRS